MLSSHSFAFLRLNVDDPLCVIFATYKLHLAGVVPMWTLLRMHRLYWPGAAMSDMQEAGREALHAVLCWAKRTHRVCASGASVVLSLITHVN